MSRRDEVLDALLQSAPECVSGEALAGRLGVSRVAVAKHVAALRKAGYEIEASPGAGYRLVGTADLPMPDQVRPLVESDFWTRYVGVEETGSTNDDARILARAGAVEGTVVLAARQKAGRGRLGRTWSSPEGGIYLSCILRPKVPLPDVPSMGHAIAVGIAEAMHGFGVEVGLKWPNDVLIDGRKLAGILLETSAETDCVNWVVAGVGTNVHRSSHPPETAAFLSDSRPDLERAPVAAALLDGIAGAYERWCKGGFAAIREEYLSRFTLMGQEVAVSDASGRLLAAGVVVDVDDAGRLCVDTGSDVVGLYAGEVTLRRS